MIEACTNCRFAIMRDPDAYGHTGRCQRFPPQVYRQGPQGAEAAFPMINAGNWCGEFEFETSDGSDKE